METMPSRSRSGQAAHPVSRSQAWFATGPGRAVLDSENGSIQAAIDQRPGQSWLWLSPAGQSMEASGRGLTLQQSIEGWQGPIRCTMPFPLASESVATVLVQHVVRPGRLAAELFEECARVLIPGGHVWLYALNPISPYRWRWAGRGLAAREPSSWRRHLRQAGLQPLGVSEGLGPRWDVQPAPGLQQGPGLRASYLLCAEKRTIPLTPMRNRAPIRLGEGVPAA
jgi:SAM-dependent methyltransferase